MIVFSKKYYILVLCILISSSLFSQVKFNKRFDVDKGAEVFNRVLVVDSNYIIAGISYDSIKIYTVTGKEVFSKNISEKSTPINISNYPKGIYFYTIISDENSFLGKLILQ